MPFPGVVVENILNEDMMIEPAESKPATTNIAYFSHLFEPNLVRIENNSN